MDKDAKLIKHILLGGFLLAYIATAVLHKDLIANFLSVAVMVLASLYLFEAALQAGWQEDNLLRDKDRTTWLLLAAACLAWGISDLLWAYNDMISYHGPENNPFFLYSYLITGIILVVAVVHYFISRMRNWNMVQFMVDASALLALSMGLFWNFFLEKGTLGFGMWQALGVTTYVALLGDFICLLLCASMLFSMPWKNVPVPFRRIGLSIIIFAGADLYNAYIYYKQLYVENSLADIIFVVSLALLGSSGLLSHRTIYPKLNVPSVIRNTHDSATKKFRLLMLIPLGLMLFGKLELGIGTMFIAVFLIHGLLSLNLQRMSFNEQLLIDEMELNEILEKRIQERTEALTKANRELDLLAKLDPLTGVYNRRHFLKGFESMLAQHKQGTEIVVFFIDLDRFKGINDAYGHDMGDAVLVQLAERLKNWIPMDSLLARLGGDEFVITIPNITDLETVERQASQMLRLVAEPIQVEKSVFKISTSIGITRFPLDGTDHMTLLHHADIAMYHSKDQGCNRYTFYNNHHSSKIQRRRELEHLLQKIDLNKELNVVYQPQFSLMDGKLVGAEALLRWNSPEKGIVPPAEFIPIAEDLDLISFIGKWVMEQALAQIQQWNSAGHGLRMGINVSPRQLSVYEFMTEVSRLIQTYDIQPDWMEIEITESSTLDNEGAIIELLAVMKSMGISVAIDDFGTGYSSLSYIKRFEIDRLKIAKQLVDSVSDDYGSVQIIKAIIMMADAMGLDTIAEGVETEEQVAVLKNLGCHEIQGLVKGDAVSPAEFERLYLR